MRIKITGIQNENEMAIAVGCGADAIGFLVGQLHKSAAFILPSSAARMARLLPPYISPVLVTHLTSAEEIIDIVRRTDIRDVQICGEILIMELMKLRDIMPAGGKIILTAYTNEQNIISNLEKSFGMVDAVTFDCFNRSPAQIGDSKNNGYCWEAVNVFMRQCRLPVILAGGLNSENVADAIQTFKPMGVDACSKLRDPSTGALQENLCRAFIHNARRAELAMANEF
jgi:phosphoribosylanthranilate isomerase